MANAIIYEISAKDSLSAALRAMKTEAKGTEEAILKLKNAVKGVSDGLDSGVGKVAAVSQI